METRIETYSREARESLLTNEGGALFKCDWVNFVLIHYEVDVKLLQDCIPFELDLYENKAYVKIGRASCRERVYVLV